MATSSAGPWSVKGVDPKAREIAKDLARRSNMTLGEWLNRFIAESGEGVERPGFQAPLREPYAGDSRRPTASAQPPAADRTALIRITEALASLSARLDQSEAGTREAIGVLHQSFADIDQRLSAAEVKLSETDAGDVERRFEALAAELSEKVEAGRAEIAERMREAAAGQFEKMGIALRDLSGHVEQTERRSAQVVERLGHEVLRVAQTLNSRVIAAENRGAQALERVSGEMARVAEQVETRMGEAERLQAEALERLGGELSRIAERLADRIAGSERRSAAAIDDIGLQVTQAADRIDARYERATADIAERIRRSEERTARLVEEAKGRFDGHASNDEVSAPVSQPVAHSAVAPAPATEPTARAPWSLAETAHPEPAAFAPAEVLMNGLERHVEPAAGNFEEPHVSLDKADADAPRFEPIHDFGHGDADPFGPLPALEPLEPFADGGPVFEPEPEHGAESHAGDDHAFDAARPAEFDAAPEAVHAEPASEFEPELVTLAQTEAAPETPAEPERPKTTRELLESARAAARLAAAGPPKSAAEERLSALSKRFSLALPKLKKKDHGLTLRTTVVAAGTATAIAVTAVGAYQVYSNDQDHTDASDRGAPMATLTPSAAPSRLQQQAASLAGDPETLSGGMAAVAITPTAATAAPSKPADPVPPPPATDASSLYSNGVRKIEAGDRSGLSQLIRAASLGLPGAQFYLAKMYESGTGGVRKDLAQARRWTMKAAQAGDVRAMHNLGLYYYEGEGGEKNVAAAASWFKRAAELGLQDSQYNLARLYQQGYGVGQNPAEAYKWYLVAAANGDSGARADASELRRALKPDEAAAAERSAALLQQQARNGAAQPTP